MLTRCSEDEEPGTEQLREATQQSRRVILRFRGPDGSVLHYATFELEVIGDPAGVVSGKRLYSRRIV